MFSQIGLQLDFIPQTSPTRRKCFGKQNAKSVLVPVAVFK